MTGLRATRQVGLYFEGKRGVFNNLIPLIKSASDLPGWFDWIISRQFKKKKCGVPGATPQKRASEFHSRVATDNTPMAARLSEAINEH